MAEVGHNGLNFEYGSAENVSVSNNTSGLLHPDVNYEAQFINFDAVSGSFANGALSVLMAPKISARLVATT